jgi:hypothetical protein
MKISRFLLGLCVAGVMAGFALNARGDDPANRMAEQKKHRAESAQALGHKPGDKTEVQSDSPEERIKAAGQRRRESEEHLKKQGLDTEKMRARNDAREDSKARRKRMLDEEKAARSRDDQKARESAAVSPVPDGVEPTPDKTRVILEKKTRNSKAGMDMRDHEKMATDAAERAAKNPRAGVDAGEKGRHNTSGTPKPKPRPRSEMKKPSEDEPK